MIPRIAVTGPESTGKSVLAELLATHYKTVWVPEYAREYLDRLSHPYEKEDVALIARGQLALETLRAENAKTFLFCDTEMLVTKIWSEVKYRWCDPWILDAVETHRYDLYLLCDIDLPWQYDPLREHPDQRQFLIDLYYQELSARKFPFAVVRGTGEARLKNAVEIIEQFNFART